jgi:hypothetical protein
MELKTSKLSAVFVLMLILLSPWFNSELGDDLSTPKVSQEDVKFYEINPCKVSLFEFISSNPQSIYQNHFYFRPDNKSSIKCFGRISGVTVLEKNLETQFFISIGTNSLVNLIYQGIVWIFFLNLIPKNNNRVTTSSTSKVKNIALVMISYFLSYAVYAESRYYQKNLYNFEVNNERDYFLIFLIFLFLLKNIVDSIELRSESILNYLPFVFLITGIFSGYNLVFYSFIFIYYGLVSFINYSGNKYFNTSFLILSLWWLFNSKGTYYFSPGKLRGFTSSEFNLNSNLFWILFAFLLLKGIWKIFLLNRESFSTFIFSKNLSIASFLLLVFGVLSANSTMANFFSYYIFGLQRNGIESNKPFAFDEYLVKISWRGLFPSSETVGEFYGICLLFILFLVLKNKKLSNFHYLGLFSSGLGLYFSDNRTAMILVFIICLFSILKITNFNKNYKFIVLLFLFVPFTAFVLNEILSESISESFRFMSDSIIYKARIFQFDSIFSSFLTLIESTDKPAFLTFFLQIFGFFAYVFNRSEMWGLFFARYNPTFSELMIGSGPLSFGQLYGEIVINNTDSFLLPHSSILSFLVFIGIIPLLILIIYFLATLINNRKNYEFVIFSIYIFINIFKNDSLNYFSSFIFYSLIFLTLLNKPGLKGNQEKSLKKR